MNSDYNAILVNKNTAIVFKTFVIKNFEKKTKFYYNSHGNSLCQIGSLLSIRACFLSTFFLLCMDFLSTFFFFSSSIFFYLSCVNRSCSSCSLFLFLFIYFFLSVSCKQIPLLLYNLMHPAMLLNYLTPYRLLAKVAYSYLLACLRGNAHFQRMHNFSD